MYPLNFKYLVSNKSQVQLENKTKILQVEFKPSNFCVQKTFLSISEMKI